jgi:hypothetical protein
MNLIKFIREQFSHVDASVFDECVGYKLLGLRASKDGNFFQVLSNETKNHLIEIMASANQDYRNASSRGAQKDIVETNTPDEVTPPNDNDASADCYVPPGVLTDHDLNGTNVGKKIRVPKCCVPGCMTNENLPPVADKMERIGWFKKYM